MVIGDQNLGTDRTVWSAVPSAELIMNLINGSSPFVDHLQDLAPFLLARACCLSHRRFTRKASSIAAVPDGKPGFIRLTICPLSVGQEGA
ncbi:hypothetical protein GCM10027256_29270 [Novispirillum itersonii subsp. nipponicum]